MFPRALRLLLLAALAGACEEPSGPPQVPITALSVTAPEIIARGDTAAIIVVAMDSSDVIVQPYFLQVVSNDQAVLRVVAGWRIVGVAPGEAEVVATTDGGISARATVRVMESTRRVTPTFFWARTRDPMTHVVRGTRVVMVAQLQGDGTDLWPATPITWAPVDAAVARLVHAAGDTAVFEMLAPGTFAARATFGTLQHTTVGVTVLDYPPATSVQRVSGTQQWDSVAAWGDATCAIANTGEVHCWGMAALGDTASLAYTPGATGIGGARQVSMNGLHACATTTAGFRCWGGDDSRFTQRGLPNGTVHADSLAVLATAAGGVTARDHGCVITTDGSVWCWGKAEQGQTGSDAPIPFGCGFNDPYYCYNYPMPADTVRDYRALVAGDLHTCGLTTQGEVWCWGAAMLGGAPTATCQYFPRTGPGPKTIACEPTPRRIAGTADAPATPPTFAVLRGSHARACGVTPDGAAYCWGTDNALPARVAPSTTFRDIAVGASHTCGITTTDEVVCWGQGGMGQLGRQLASSDAPVTVALPGAARAIAAGANHTCTILGGGGMYCWGDSKFGQLGVGVGAPPVQGLDVLAPIEWRRATSR